MRWFLPRRRPRITVDEAPHEAQRRMLEDLARRLNDRESAQAARRRTRSRRATAGIAAAAVMATLATTLTTAAIFNVNLGVPLLDRILRVERPANDVSIKPRPQVIAGSASPPVTVSPGNGADGAVVAAFVDKRQGLCLSRAVGRGDDRHVGQVGCATVRWVSRQLGRQPVYATGWTFGPTSIVVGFTRADVVDIEMRDPNGRPVNVALLRRVWAPRSARGARPMRVFIGAYRLTRGRLEADIFDEAIELRNYVARVRLRSGRTIRMNLRQRAPSIRQG